MHLLLVNDDGINACGIRTLCEAAARAGHRVSICAPDRERSAASHSITLTRPLKAEKVEVPGAETAYAVDGMPADCARLGLYLVPDVDLVISGINDGANLGGACVYSGTVGAAMEASMSGTPALAVSLCGAYCQDFSAAAKIAVAMLEWVVANPLPRGAVYNVNVPEIPYDQIKGICAATLANNYLDTPVYRPVETEEGLLYAYTHGVNEPIIDPEYDLLKVREGYVAVTKVTWDMRLNAPQPDLSGIQLEGK